MYRYHLFYNNELIEQIELLPDVELEKLQNGTYIFASERNQWYQVLGGTISSHRDHSIKDKDVPKELKVLCLIHGITPSKNPY